jgi:hypothetical protein
MSDLKKPDKWSACFGRRMNWFRIADMLGATVDVTGAHSTRTHGRGMVRTEARRSRP